MKDSMTPYEFYERFTKPAIEHWTANQGIDHLAVHALSQIAILADVAQSFSGRTDYRKKLEARHNVLRTIRDAVNSHKHGWPSGKIERQSFKQGQRAEAKIGHGFFVGVTYCGRPLTPYKYIGLTNDDGTLLNVGHLILVADRIWQDELSRLSV
jgi:hypothetical protein